MRTRLSLVLALLLFVGVICGAYAWVRFATSPALSFQPIACPSGTVSATVRSVDRTVQAGKPLHFSVTVTNGNQLPLADGQVTVQIIRRLLDSGAAPAGSLVDQFVVPQGLNVASGQSTTVQASWLTPVNLPSGAYTFQAAVQGSNQLNAPTLLSYADNLTGQPTFSVQGKETDGLVLDESNILSNARPLSGYPNDTLFLDSGSNLFLQVPFKNEGSTAKSVTVHWQAYDHFTGTTAGEIGSENQSLSIEPGETKVSHYILSNVPKPGIGVRLTVADGQSQVIGLYDIFSSQESQVVMQTLAVHDNQITVCLALAGEKRSGADADAQVSLKDGDGAVLAKANYQGTVGLGGQGLRATLPSGTHFSQGTLAGSVNGQALSIAYGASSWSRGQIIGLIIATLALVGVAALVWRRRRV